MQLKYVIPALFIHFQCFSQLAPNVLLDSTIERAKITSMYTNVINWDSLTNVIHQKAIGAQTVADLKPAFETLLNGIGDHHGNIRDASNFGIVASFTDFSKMKFIDTRVKEIEDWKIINDPNLEFEYKVLTNNIGYLKIVGIGPNADIEKTSKQIRAAVNKLYRKNIDKWIIDLRYNAGGNMHPMMEGIGPLIGDGLVGSVVDINSKQLFTWQIRDGNIVYGDLEAVTLKNKIKYKSEPKIAVLTSRWTASSGEIVATACKGRSHTKFFGEATSGFTSNTNWEIIDNQIILNISTGFYCDRNNIVYDQNIPVDIEIPFTITGNTAEDKCIQAAIDWLIAVPVF